MMIKSTLQAPSTDVVDDDLILDGCGMFDDRMSTSLEDRRDEHINVDKPSVACQDSHGSGDSESVEWEGTKYTVRRDAQFGTYETRTDDDGGDAVDSAQDDSDPFAIFGGYAQYELFHLLATSTMSKAFISKYLELQIWVRIRLNH